MLIYLSAVIDLLIWSIITLANITTKVVSGDETMHDRRVTSKSRSN